MAKVSSSNQLIAPASRRFWEGLALILAVALVVVGQLLVLWAMNKGWTTYVQDSGRSGGYGTRILALAADEEGRIWAGTDTSLSAVMPDGSWTNYKTSTGVIALVVDENGSVWAGKYGGLSVLAPDGSWTVYTKTDSGPDDRLGVYALASDDQGRVWVGTFGGLSMHSPDGSWTNYVTPNKDKPAVKALVVDRSGSVWAGSDTGLNVLAPDGSWTTYTTVNSGLADDRIYALAGDDQGRVWVGTFGGLSMHSPDGSWATYTTANSGLAEDYIWALAIDDQGFVWASTISGLSVLLPDGSWITYTPANSGLGSRRNESVRTLVFAQSGHVWAANYGYGLSVLDEDAAVAVRVVQALIVGRNVGAAMMLLLIGIQLNTWRQHRAKRASSNDTDALQNSSMPRSVATLNSYTYASKGDKIKHFFSGLFGWLIIGSVMGLALSFSDVLLWIEAVVFVGLIAYFTVTKYWVAIGLVTHSLMNFLLAWWLTGSLLGWTGVGASPTWLTLPFPTYLWLIFLASRS